MNKISVLPGKKIKLDHIIKSKSELKNKKFMKELLKQSLY